ncbi:MAG TPA: hypothetical protein VGL77_04930 [Armatimonadota bacterium]
MLRWLFGILYAATPVVFASDYDLETSVARLAAATTRRLVLRDYLMALPVMVGKVTAAHVSLYRRDPLLRNLLGPHFFGRFAQDEGQVRLIGVLTIHPYFKVLYAISFGLCLIMALVSLLVLGMSDGWLPLYICAGLLCLSIGLVLVGKWLAREDSTWLAARIQQALRK